MNLTEHADSVAMALERLIHIIQRLRDPVAGCPWDSQQDFMTLLPSLLEETHEVIAAVEAHDTMNLKEELGDVLFHIIFYSQLAQKQGLFDFTAVCNTISDKMLQRHPKVFNSAINQELSWEALKQQSTVVSSHFFDRIPQSLPALMYAQAIQQCCHQAEFECEKLPPVLDKVTEQLQEVSLVLIEQPSNKKLIAEELGNLLLAVVNLVRHAELDSEAVLRSATHKFKGGFLEALQNIERRG